MNGVFDEFNLPPLPPSPPRNKGRKYKKKFTVKGRVPPVAGINFIGE